MQFYLKPFNLHFIALALNYLSLKCSHMQARQCVITKVDLSSNEPPILGCERDVEFSNEMLPLAAYVLFSK
jgi:hypothetical protein